METSVLMKESKKNPISLILIILLFLSMAGVIGFLAWENSQKKKEVTVANNTLEKSSKELEQQKAELIELQGEFEILMADREGLSLVNDSLALKMEKLKAEVIKLQSADRLDDAKVKELTAYIERLKLELATQKGFVSQLKREIKNAQSKNDSLTFTTMTQADKIDELSAQNKDFEEKVKLASVLQAENIAVTFFNAKGSDKTKIEKGIPTVKLRNLDQLKVAFNLANNEVAEKNSKKIYLRISNEQGNCIHDDFSTGTLQLADKTAIEYTQVQTILFDNSHQKLSYIYKHVKTYQKGLYTVYIYCEGHHIGSSKFKIE